MGDFVLGILGAARIAGKALVEPARKLGVEVVVAARDERRARQFAKAHEPVRSAASYEALLADPGVSAIYVALPAALHEEWTERALLAGKHVLVEKPATLDEAAASRLVALSRERGLVLLEAHHSDFHPLRSAFADGLRELGEVWHVETWFDAPIAPGDIRREGALGAGALTDFGCYLVRWLLWVGEGLPEIRRARVRVAEPEVDDAFYGEGFFPSGASFALTCDMHSSVPFRAGISVLGREGRVVFENPLALVGSSVVITRAGRRETISTQPDDETTYLRQLRAFLAAVRGGPELGVAGNEIVVTQRLLAEFYAASGLAPRAVLARSSGVTG